MLRTVHRYRTIFLAIIVLSSFALAFSGFVGELFSPQRSGVAAITVNTREISFDQFQQERRSLEQIYRSQFGANYFNIVRTLNLNIQQQAIDRSISNALLEELAHNIGLFVGDENIAEQLRAQVGVGPEAVVRYRMILDQLGISADQFKNELRTELLRSQLQRIILDASTPSRREILAVLQLEKTAYQVAYAEFSPESYASAAPAASEEEIQAYYDAHQVEFEIPEKVQYRYAVLDPEQFKDLVELAPEDIELYYLDHEREFSLPEKRRARMVQLEVVSSSNENKDAASVLDIEKQAVKSAAQELLKKAKEGTPMAELARTSSQHKESAGAQGDLGLVTREELTQRVGAQIAEAVFALEPGAFSELIEDDRSFSFVQLEDIAPATPKPLDEVKGTIEAELRAMEAPAYTSTEALEIYDLWTSSKAPLDKFLGELERAKGRLSVKESKGLVTAAVDPEGEALAKGLSAKVLEDPDTLFQLIELPNSSVLVEVVDYQPQTIDTLENVRAKIAADLRTRKMEELALNGATTLLAEAGKSKESTLQAAASAHKAAFNKVEGVTRKDPKAPFTDPAASEALFGLSSGKTLPEAPVKLSNGHVLVFQIISTILPKNEELEKDLTKMMEEEADRLGQLTSRSIISRLKAEAEIDIQPSLLSSENEV